MFTHGCHIKPKQNYLDTGKQNNTTVAMFYLPLFNMHMSKHNYSTFS